MFALGWLTKWIESITIPPNAKSFMFSRLASNLEYISNPILPGIRVCCWDAFLVPLNFSIMSEDRFGHFPPAKCLAPIVPIPEEMVEIALGKNVAAVICRDEDEQ